jgi:hypothetical protein
LALMKTLTTEKGEDRRRGEKKGFTSGDVKQKERCSGAAIGRQLGAYRTSRFPHESTALNDCSPVEAEAFPVT